MSPELREPGGGPEKPRPAATVILARQHSEGIQVYLLKRSPQSGFFPGNYVFPGGAVGSQDRDSQFWGARSDLPGAELSKRFGTALKDEEILPFCVSAIRETFEEAGVLLAEPGKSAGEWLGDARNRRISGGLPKGWLLDGARNGSFMLGISLLAPWSHWITPEAMPRRFDTRFFVAFMPSEQISSPDCRETVKGIWTRPKDGLAANLKGEIALSPPTLVTLHQLLPYERAEDLKAVLKGRSWGDPVIPRLIRLSRGAMIVEPWDPWYDRQLEIGTDDLESAIVPLGEPFSRIWLHEGVWRPVRIQVPQGIKNMKRSAQPDAGNSDLEKELNHSDEKYRSIFENSVEGMFQSTPKGRFIAVNAALANIHGFASPEEMIAKVTNIGRQLWVSKEERRRYTELLRADGVVENFEGEMYRKDGTRVWLSLSTRAIRDIDGSLLFYQGIAEDITYKRRAEEALRESEERYRLLFENSADGIVLATPEGKILAANDAACRMFGRSEEELRAVGRAGIVDNTDPIVIAALQSREQTGILRAEYLHIRKDGTRFLAEVTSSVFKDKEGKAKVSTILRDVTEVRKAEEERKELERQLRQARKMEAIGTLAGGIAHEFNNILGIILGNAELAMMDVPEEGRARARLREVEKASFRARDMIRQLLSFSRKGEVNRRPILIGDLYRDSLKLLRASIPTSIEIRQHIDPEMWPVLADPTQLGQVIINLCANASDAMPDGGLLELRLRNMEVEAPTSNLPAGKYVELSVSDTGTGIPAEFLDRIYDPYFTTKAPGKGTGLGLAVVHGIIQDHDGQISVESVAGKGTTFHVFLPAINELPEKETDTEAGLPKGSEVVLFIDDEPAIAEMAKSMLERLGYSVETKIDPVEAVESFKADPEKFHLVITDTTMPRMMGDQVAMELLKVRPHTRIIICTGYSERVNEQTVRNLGIKGFLMKPLHFQALASMVRKVLDEPEIPKPSA